MTTSVSGTLITPWNGDAVELRQAAGLYSRVFAEPPYGDDVESSRESFVERVTRYSTTKPAFRLLLARDGGRVAGLVLGAGIAEGDWWRDRIVQALDSVARDAWLGDECFSVSELAIEPDRRRSGVAAALMRAVLAGLPYRTAVLGCYSAAQGARNFYASQGWQEIVTDFRIGDGPEIRILGIRLSGGPEDAVASASEPS